MAKAMTRRDLGAGAIGLGLATAASLGGPAKAALSPIVDSHTHTFVQGLPLAVDARYRPDYDASYERLLGMADRNGVGKVVISQPSFLGQDNSYLYSALKARPDRLRGVPWVGPRVTTAEWDEMARIGVVGLRFPIRGLAMPNWADYREVFSEARKRELHLHLYDDSARLPEVLPVFLDSGANIVVPHMGMFDTKLGPAKDPGFKLLMESASLGRVYVMLNSPYRTSVEGAREAAPMLMETFGPPRLLWGSDWPHTNTTLDRVTTYGEMLAAFKAWVPDAKAQRTILVDTPTKLFRFG